MIKFFLVPASIYWCFSSQQRLVANKWNIEKPQSVHHIELRHICPIHNKTNNLQRTKREVCCLAYSALPGTCSGCPDQWSCGQCRDTESERTHGHHCARSRYHPDSRKRERESESKKEISQLGQSANSFTPRLHPAHMRTLFSLYCINSAAHLWLRWSSEILCLEGL
uniref:Uncharacterized protein n=1 Tax=Cyprinus carpio carpio TaxID=630221 RepID=A0A9J8DG44_CYPCA